MNTEMTEEGNEATGQPDNDPDGHRDEISNLQSPPSEQDLRDALARLGRCQEGVMVDAARTLLNGAITELLNFRAGAPPVDAQLRQQIQRVEDWLAERDGYDRKLPFDQAIISLVQGFSQIAVSGARQIADLHTELEQFKRLSAAQQHASDNHAPLRAALVACNGALSTIRLFSDTLRNGPFELVPTPLTHVFALFADWCDQALKASADALVRPSSPAKREASDPSEISDLKSAPEST